MTKADLGIKRLCPNCGTKYYDLNRSPITCPRCGTIFEPIAAKARPQTVAKPAEQIDEPVVVSEQAEVVSLEQADEEVTDSGQVKPGVVGDVDDVEEIEADDDTVLQADVDEDEDVADIIGGDDDDDEI